MEAGTRSRLLRLCCELPMTSLKWILLSAAGIYVLILIGMYLFQRNLLYFPHYSKQGEIDHNYSFESGDVTLKGWAINRSANRALIYFGGNADRADAHIDWLSTLFPDHALYLLNYRGYGNSDGEPTESGITADAVALYDEITSQHESISLIGRSLGSGVATHLAAKREVDQTVLITPYDSIVRVASVHYPLVPVGLLMHDRWESWKNARNIDSRTLVIYGGEDRTVPPASTERLIEHFDASILQTLLIDDAGHIDIMESTDFTSAVAEFITEQRGTRLP